MQDFLWQYINGAMQPTVVGVDRPWAHNIRSQIFCRNQEEKDYLISLNLMHGREIQVDIWKEWLKMRQNDRTVLAENKSPYMYAKPRVLPFAYSTHQINLRGF